jgi:hypothetical protein
MSSAPIRVLLGVLLAGVLTPMPAQAQPSQLSVDLKLTNGSLSLGVLKNGRTVLPPAPVGLRTAEADLTTGLREIGRSQRVVTEQYTMTTGKRRTRSARMTETRVAYQGTGGRFDLVVRVAPDGIAYRYVLPQSMTVTGEASAFTLPADSPAWLLPYNAWYEANRVRTTASSAAAGDYGYPSLFQVGNDFVLLTESDVDGRYSGSRLRHTTGTNYQVVLADAQVTATSTPWRTAIIGDLATVTGSTLVDDLATPAKVADTSWIRPGKVAWSWLSEHSSPGNFQRQKEYVDFAARNGWQFVLVDEGWSADWVPELTRYARAKGVDVLLWFHWSALDTAAERDSVLPQVQRWGVRGVKLDFMESDTQTRYQWYDAVLAKTAEQHLMVNFHGSTIPHGLARTWPHIMTMEGVRGAENMPSAVNNPVQAFTRNVVGSMDYTPVSLDVGPKETSVAHEVALPIVYESGWTHFADKPEAYERRPQALRFLDQVPTVWDDTRLVGGHPDNSTVMARRNGSRWFLGAIASGDARTITAPLGFLGGGEWLVEVVRDSGTDVARTSQVLRSSATLSIPVPRNGGFAAQICPNRPGRTSCDEPIRQVPATSLTVSPPRDANRGESFEVTGTFSTSATIRDVALTATAPPGWTVTGPTIHRAVLNPGETITGRWTATVGQQQGFVDVPIFAEFGAERVHVEQAVRVFVPPDVPTGTPYVSDLPFISQSNGWGPIERDRSNNESAGNDGNPLRIGGTAYAKGIGVHAASALEVYLGRRCTTFTAQVGLDDETTQTGSVVFQVFGDDRLLHEKSINTKGPAQSITVDTTGTRMLSLRVTDGGDGKNFDHADWADARLSCG